MEVTDEKHEPVANNSVFRMQINDTKAGMNNLDKEKINSIILKHSQSKFETKLIKIDEIF